MNSTEYANWLQSLSVDDSFTVVISSRWGMDTLRVMTVSKVTPKRVEISGDQYNRENGRKIGDRYSDLPKPATQKEIDRVRRDHAKSSLIAKIKKTELKEIEFSKLVDIAAILGIE